MTISVTLQNRYPIYPQALSVPFRYPVHFTRNLFAMDVSLLEEAIGWLKDRTTA